MKRKHFLFGFVAILMVTGVCLTACDDINCSDIGQLDCGNDTCCKEDVPWTDGHGSCYSSLSYCRQTGWNCTKCW
ncbi:MAG: hypothetical protein LBR17_03460 [Bacteroidales bacterium]|nr:hypothetical protein [Bacteroidales bacterium]